MENFWRRKAERLIYLLNGKDKEYAEIKFWRRQIDAYLQWYEGGLTTLYGHTTPNDQQKVYNFDRRVAALLTFFKIHQMQKYKTDLLLDENEFKGMRVLDVGSGPFPSALCFKDCDVYSLDPLIDSYVSAGYPLHCYESRSRFVCALAENIPFEDGFFDAIISVNAIDHVNDFSATAKELKRVLKPGGRFRMHVHYHPKTKAEPLELNDEVFLQNYSWVHDLKRISASKEKTGTNINNENELYVVWGN